MQRQRTVSWKTKKYIIQTICAMVLAIVMGVSLFEQLSDEKQKQLAQNTKRVQAKKIEQTDSSTKLYLDNSVLEEQSNNMDEVQSYGQSSKDNVHPDNEKVVQSEQENNGAANGSTREKTVSKDTVAEQRSSQEVSDLVCGNRVVKNAVRENVQENRVEENSEPLFLIEGIFENHGTAPKMGEVICKYQFPVEIGYAMDKNYEGKNNPGDLILNKVFDVEEEVSEEVSGDASKEEATITDETFTGENNQQSQDTEMEILEDYRKDVWKKILATEPVEVEVKKQQGAVVVTENTETDGSGEVNASEKVSEEDISTTETLTQVTEKPIDVVQKEITAGYYIIKGKMREDSEVFVSNIEIVPVGLDGFDQVRLGEEGEFASSLLITEDAMNREVQLYFSDGQRITEATSFTYSKDTVTPELQILEEELQTIPSGKRTIYCTNDRNIRLRITDGDASVANTLAQVRCLYADKLQFVVDHFEEPKITLTGDYYGRLLLNCKDKAGNVSDIKSQFVLVDQNKPDIMLAQDERCSAPYTLWAEVAETGDIVSGIRSIQCEVNGEIYDVSDAVVRETYTLDENLDVSSKVAFPIELTETGSYAVYIRVTDYAGNETIVEQAIEVTEPELVSVYMPKNFTIHIDPQQLAGREQIYSDDITLKNVSAFDVCVQVDEVIVNVKDEMSDTGVKKDCDIYLVAPDTGEKIKLKKGTNEDVYTYCLPAGENIDIENLHFVGETTEGSEQMWKGSDVSIQISVSFKKWEEI